MSSFKKSAKIIIFSIENVMICDDFFNGILTPMLVKIHVTHNFILNLQRCKMRQKRFILYKI